MGAISVQVSRLDAVMKTTIFRMVMPEVRGKSPMHKTGAHSYSTRKPGAALAQTPNRLGGIVARGALRVGTTGDYKPFSFRAGKTGEFIGLDIQLAGDLARAVGSLDAVGISAAAARQAVAGLTAAAPQ